MSCNAMHTRSATLILPVFLVLAAAASGVAATAMCGTLSVTVGPLWTSVTNGTSVIVINTAISVWIFKAGFNRKRLSSAFEYCAMSPYRATMFCGGFLTFAYVTIAATISSRVGVGLLMVFQVTGQLATSMAIEALGLCQMPQAKPGSIGMSGGALVLFGALLFHLQSIISDNLSVKTALAGLGGLPLGIMLTVEQVMHRTLGLHLGSPAHGGAFNYALAMPYFVTLALGMTGVPRYSEVPNFAPSYLGYYATAGWYICGSLLSSLVVDTFGLLGMTKVPAHGFRLAGLGVLLSGVGMIEFDRHVRRIRGTLLPLREETEADDEVTPADDALDVKGKILDSEAETPASPCVDAARESVEECVVSVYMGQ
eukprot:Polyplicarium_translucidae@DN1737_c0_g1_i1.p1